MFLITEILIIYYHYTKNVRVLAVWLSGNALASINVVALRQTRLVPGWVTRLWTGKPYRYVTSQLGRLSLLPSVGR